MSASSWRTQVQSASRFLVCSLIFIEYHTIPLLVKYITSKQGVKKKDENT